MAKARAGFHGPAGTGINQLVKGMGGAEYILSLLTGYTGNEKTSAGVTLYENTAYPGGWISMAPPLEDELVEFEDGHKNDLQHLSEDISAFLMWTAEPKLNDRKRAGMVGVLILGFLRRPQKTISLAAMAKKRIATRYATRMLIQIMTHFFIYYTVESGVRNVIYSKMETFARTVPLEITLPAYSIMLKNLLHKVTNHDGDY